ncbi:MAG: ABC transporter ATP-binding protein [Candidatus Accumulibacter sp.]|jgi:peptide/nickel transport system ATP-binding protein|nr:ABC transporter ATP-binding protein [Accumulibacter sp.]
MTAALELRDLTVTLDLNGVRVPVIEGLSLRIEPGKTLALAGESGCGKSMTALAIMGLLPEGFRVSSGAVFLGGEEISQLPPEALRKYRGSRMSMIFQEPMTALNPLFTIGYQIAEVLSLHQGLGRKACRERAIQWLRMVGIPAAETRVDAYPHELSGGMRQRVMIVIALACSPDLLIADEPTTALDVTVQAQIFDLLADLQRQTGTCILLITHNLDAVVDIADELVVLYAGRCVEAGSMEKVLGEPLHPYARGLIACVPRLYLGDQAQEQRALLAEIPGMVPPLGKRSAACPFATRCLLADGLCFESAPTLRESAPGCAGHNVACWRHQPECLQNAV